MITKKIVEISFKVNAKGEKEIAHVWAVLDGTIYEAADGVREDIEYVQILDGKAVAFFTKGELFVVE
jgi:hypothetical protein